MHLYIYAHLLNNKRIGRAFCLMMFLCLGANSFSQTIIARQDFESTPATPTMTFSTSDIGSPGSSTGFSTGQSGASGSNSPSAVNLFSEGSRGYRIQGPNSGSTTAGRTFTFSDVNTTGYSSISFSIKLAGMSLGSNANGIDATIDEVLIEVSPDGGTTWYQQAKVVSNAANLRWYFGATGSGSRAYAADNVFSSFTTTANVTSGSASTAITTATITDLPAVTNLKIRVSAQTNTANESWIIDDARISGTVAATPSIAISSAHPSTGNISQASSNNIIGSLQLDVTTASATLTGVTVTTAGTYQTADIASNGFKFWINSTNDLTGATQLGSSQAVVSSGNTVSVSSLSQNINSGSTRYLLFTADIDNNATLGRTINIGSTAFSNISFSSGNKTGTNPAAASNSQTIIACTPVNVTSAAASNGNTASTLTWVNPSCFDEILIVASTASNTGTPTGDGSAYTASLTYGSGTALGNGFVLYKGSTSSQTVTSLINGTPYFFKFFTRKGTTWSAGTETSATPVLATASTDYFRSNVTTGNWGTAGSWQSSADNNTWITSTLVPDNNANTITIRNGHTITVAASVTADQIEIASGGILAANSSLTIIDGTGDDLIIQSGGTLQYSTASSFTAFGSGTPTVSNETGGKILVTTSGVIQNLQTTNYVYKSSSILEYTSSNVFTATGITYFPNVDAATIPIFRISTSIGGNIGGGTATVFNGMLQLGSGVTINWGGASLKTFRNGVTALGTASMILGASSGAWQIGNASAGNAEIGGSSGVLTLTNSNGISVTANCTATLSSSTVIGGGTFTNNGILICGTNALTGVGNFTLGSSSTISTANTSGVNGSIAVSGSKSFSATGTTYTFNGNTITPFPTSFGNPATININANVVSNQSATLTVTSALNVNNGGTFTLNGTNNLTLNGNLIVAVGGTFDNGGESQLTNGGGSITINGTFVTKDAQGFTGSNTAIPSITPILGTGSTIVYGLSGDQAVTNFAYENLTFSGSGIKSTSGSVSSITGTVTINTGVTLNTATNTFGGSGTNLTMIGTARFITGGSSTKPNISGIYTLDATSTIEFSGSSATIIRSSPSYGNIDISGTNVSLSGTSTSIGLQSGSSFTVKSTGTFNVKNSNGFSGASNTAISNTNSPTITLETGSTVNFNDVAQPITPGLNYSNITLSGSGAKTAASSFTVNGTLTLTGTASLGTSSPTYGAGSTLAYVNSTDGITYTEALEWPNTNPPANVTVNLSGITNPTVVIASNKTITGALTLTAGTFNINGNTLTLNGTLAGSGLLQGSPTSNITIGGTGSLGTLNFDQTTDGTTNALSNLTYSKAGGFSLGNKLVLIDVITPTAGTLTTGGFLHLRSTASNTARVAAGSSSGGYISGNVTVERFVSASSNRAYRLITPSVNTSTTINANWQEGQSNPDFATNMPAATAGYGTHITGTGGSTNGFDATGSNQASLYIYNPANPSWDAVTNTNINTLSANTGYLLFIRGNRDNGNVLQQTTPSSNTIIRATGTLPQGSISLNNLSSNTAFSLVANPYASPILWDNATGIYSAGSNATNFENYITIWDPNIGTRGGYVTVTTANITGGGATNLTNEIQSGQAFFVQTKTGITAPTLDLLETHKSTTNNLNVFRTGTQTETLKTFLYYTDNTGAERSADGVTSIFNNNYSNNIDGRDAVQIDNWDEDVAIRRSNKSLSIEARNLADANDTIPLAIARLKTQAYKWKLVPQNFNAPNVIAQLRDNFTNTNTTISLTDTTVISFSATTDPASKAANRFCIVFKQNAAVPVTISSIKAYTKNNTVQVEWETRNEINISRYEVEKSVDAVHFSKQATQLANGSTLYNSIDLNPAKGNNFYRVKIIEKSGRESFTQVVKVAIGASASFVSIYPNPVASNQVALQLNNLAKGSYHISIINSSGQIIFSKILQHNGGTSTEYLQINSPFSNGVYQLIVKGEGQQFSQELLKQ